MQRWRSDMFCRMSELKNKYVINVRNGSRLGYVSDLELDTSAATINAITVRGRLRAFGLLGREPDMTVPWENVEVIGEDTVLVNHDLPAYSGEKKTGRLFRILTED